MLFLPSDELARLDTKFGDQYLEKIGLFGRLASLSSLLWHFPRIVLPVLAIAVLHGTPYRKRFRRARRLLGHFALLIQLRSIAESRIVVLDDGFLQRLWSLVIESSKLRGQGTIARLLAEYYTSIAPLAVELLISGDVTERRVFNRVSRGRFNRNSSAERRRRFPRWLEYHRELVTLLPPTAVQIKIDAETSPAEIANKVRLALNRIISDK